MPIGLEKLGAYRLIAELGHGGMGEVFLGAIEGPQGSGFTKLAVLKMLRSHLAEDPQFIAMLMDEARITARLDHPNTVRLYELGRDGSHYFLAMEYLNGQPLDRLERRAARRGVTVPREVYFAILADVLAGLHHAHQLADYDGKPLEIVHRDVTPHNVFVTYDGTVKVVDFGLAKARGRATHTSYGTRKGKLRYMSPEQALAHPLDRRTDLFSVGLMLWAYATGRKMWAEKTEPEIGEALKAGTFPASPRLVDPEVPEAIDAICRKALAVQPSDRYRTAEAMRADIERFLGRDGLAARRQLTTLMSSLFDTDRERVRAVLENADLSRQASATGFRRAMRGTPRPSRAPRAMTPPAGVPAIARSASTPRSPSEVNLHRRSATPASGSSAASNAVGSSRSSSEISVQRRATNRPRSRKKKKGSNVRAVVSLVVGLVLGAAIPVTAALLYDDGAKSLLRMPAVFTKEVTPRADQGRAKAERPDAGADASADDEHAKTTPKR